MAEDSARHRPGPSERSEQLATLAGPGLFEWVARRSRFVGLARPATSEERVRAIVEAVRREWPKANHYPYAWRLGAPVHRQKMSDDGEPAGTAGRPILGTLERFRITDACVVVVRYFGGVLLGAGPLARAYARSAEGAVARAGVIPVVAMRRWEVRVSYARLEALSRAADRLGGNFVAAGYGVDVRGVLTLPAAAEALAVEAVLALTEEATPLQ